MKKQSIKKALILSFTTLLMTQCGGGSEDVINKTTEETVNTNQEVSPRIEIDTTDYDYEFVPPSPIQIASILRKANMPYEDGLTNPTENADNYASQYKQSLNFGVYACDLAYCVTNNKSTEAAEYLKTVKKMSAKVGLSAVFDNESLIKRFENNIGNQDSVMSLLFDIQMLTDDYIQDNELRDLSVIYFTGAWVEGMNIGTHTIVGNTDHKISVLLSEQMTIAESIIRGLRAVENPSNDLVDLTDHIEEVVDAYHNLWSVKKEGENIEYLDVELTHDEVVSISDMILELREEITM
ncbi:MAG: hypothetical protein VX134_01145 [Bacteroidota bacterium]|nr:hypothetical protein [Bacteroidota bacterium]